MRRVETRLRRAEGDNGMENVGLHDLPCSTTQHSTATAASHLRRKSISLEATGRLTHSSSSGGRHTAGLGSVCISLCSARDRVLV